MRCLPLAIAPLAATLAAATLVAQPSPATAGGAYVGENGGQALARAGAFVAKSDDPTSMVHNPAGLAKTDGTKIYLSVNVVNQNNSFQRDGEYGEELVLPIFGEQPGYVGDPYPMVSNQSPTSPVPMIAASFRVGRLAIGAGLFAPHAPSGRSFNEAVATRSGEVAPAPQRYDTVYQTGIAAFPSLALAYNFDRLRVGVRGSYGFSNLETEKVQQLLGNEAEADAWDVKAHIEAGDSSIFTWGAGAQLEIASWLEIAAAYSSETRVEAVGTAAVEFSSFIQSVPVGLEIEPVPDEMALCAPGGEPGAIKACIDFVLPASANFGGRLVQRDGEGNETGDLELNLRWEQWSAAAQQRAVIDGQDSLLGTPLGETIVESGYHDSWGIRVGGSKSTTTSFGRVEIRGGAGYDGPSKPKQWAVISNDGAARWTGSGGLAFSTARYRFDLGGSFTQSDTITVTELPIGQDGQADQPTTGSQLGDSHAYNVGTYFNRYWIVSLGVQAGW